MDMNFETENGYYWVSCEEIDSSPVIAEYCNGDWFFCGFKKAFKSIHVKVLSKKLPIFVS